MPNSSAICCDTNLVVDWVMLPEQSPAVLLVSAWFNEGRTFVAPQLLLYEATNVLFRREKFGQIPSGASRDGLNAILALNMTFVSDTALHLEALALAQRFRSGAAYDAHFLAVAEREQCKLWTGDKRLFNAVHGRFPLIRYVDRENT